MNALEIKNLNKTFDGFELKNINLELPKGYILGYVGQNGAGKTTTIKLIMNQLKKDSGVIKVFGKSYEDGEEVYKDMIGFIGDECYFPINFTLKDVISTLKDFILHLMKVNLMIMLKNGTFLIRKNKRIFKGNES
ncbi:ABC-type multidrug transport system ATPase subunit [Clostridium beijerinckii]|uniref:ATP-binding cassette domain-containing protein n=1 Tax=Clostridium beijerinckii TaxID=1520 RepID=UPI003F5C27A1|nr:ABC-type multidrug transport system ATPase subunit [Clostridium beijerinckii]